MLSRQEPFSWHLTRVWKSPNLVPSKPPNIVSCPSFSVFTSVVAGVDPSYHPVAGEPCGGADHASHAAEAGGFPGLQARPQASTRPGEMPAGDQLQHPADEAPLEQPPSLHALRGEDGVGES